MRRLIATVLLAALAIAGALPQAAAYLKAGPNMSGPGHHRLKTPGGGPIDSVAAADAAYGFRKLRSDYTGPALRIRRNSDQAELDIGFSGAPWDEAAAVAHCAATTCFLRTWYDQSGTSKHRQQATAANQPALVFGCVNGMACARTTTTVQRMDGPSITPANPVSMVAVARRTAGTAANAGLLSVGGAPANRMLTSTANTWQLAAASGLASRAATDGAWHTILGVVQGAGSVLNIDGGEQTSAITTQTTAGTIFTSGINTNTMDEVETIFWNGYALTADERAALVANQRAYWNF